jgi:hypothetical protein
MDRQEAHTSPVRPVLDTRAFAPRALLWLLFLCPLFYVAYITNVVVHEAVGHGVTALLCGGQFSRFDIHLDGMGYAYAWSHDYPNLVSAAGVLAEIAVGLPLMALALLDRRSALRRAALAVFATLFLVSAGSYGFWNTYYPRPPGDWGRILDDLDSPTLRLALVVGFGLLYAASSIAGSAILFRALEDHLGPLYRWRLVAVLAFFVTAGIALNFLLDWNQLIENVGRVPQYGGAYLQLAVSLVLPLWLRPDLHPAPIPSRRWILPIAASWAACGAIVLGILKWAARGISW